MKNIKSILGYFSLCFFLIFSFQLQAQTDAIITKFKIRSFFSNGNPADSILYQAEMPAIGPVQLDDTLQVFSLEGNFELEYIPSDDSVFVAMWLDNNDDGVFEEGERIYFGMANGGVLLNNFTFPPTLGSHQVLLAISKEQNKLADPRELPINQAVSSLKIFIQSGPPKLAIGSKPGTLTAPDPLENTFCDTVKFELYNEARFATSLEIDKWELNYYDNSNSNITMQVNARVKLVGGNPITNPCLSSSTMLELELNLSGLNIKDKTTATLKCYSSTCNDTTNSEVADYIFTKDCTIVSTNNLKKIKDKVRITIMPNPINNNTTIEYFLPSSGKIDLSIRDINGRLVKQFKLEKSLAGKHKINYSTPYLQQGIYYLVLQTEDDIISKKIVAINN